MKYILIIFIAFFTTQTLADNFVLEMLNKRSDGQRMVFSEDITHVEVGDTITWLPTTTNHNVHFLAGPEGWDMPIPSQINEEYSYTFEIPGIYYYQCTPHDYMGMIALVVVGGDTSNIDVIAEAKAVGKGKKKLKQLLKQL